MMKKIDLNNYEAWFLDHIEGNLSENDTQELYSFLDQHPELAEELDLDLKDLSLSQEEVKLDNKESLKVSDDSILISESIIDDLMISSVEGELNDSQLKQLAEYVEMHELEGHLKAYESTVLIPDMNEIMPDKGKMKVRPVIIPLYARVASVAAVGVLLIGLAWNYSGNDPVEANNPKGEIELAESVGKYSAEPSHKRDFTINPIAHQVDPVVNTDDNLEHKQDIEDYNIPQDFIVEEMPDSVPINKEESKIIPIKEDNILPDDNITEIVDSTMKEEDIIEDGIAQSGIVHEEPYKMITDAAGNFINRDVSFVRNKDVQEDEYVAYSFKIGRFEVERKKSK